MELTMKSVWSLLLASAVLFFSACSDGEEEVVKSFSDYELNGITIKDGYYTDKRNNREYRIMEIWLPPYSNVMNLWFAENLDYVDSTLEDGSWCYNDNKDSCKTYGRLYTWEAANKACPEGWRLPTQEDWNSLYSVVSDRIEPAGTKLKTIDHWQNSEGVLQGTNRFGFYGLPAGRKNAEGGWLPTGKFAYFWTSSDSTSELAYGWQLTHETDALNYGVYYKDHGMSVRCVVENNYSSEIHIEGSFDSSYVDEIPMREGKLEYKGQTYKTVEIWGKTYMAENLNYETGNSWCYNNSADSCKKYGRLYDLETALTACPEGWKLFDSGVELSGKKLIPRESAYILAEYYAEEIKSEKGWVKSPGSNLSGFNLQPAGGYDIASEAFFDMGYSAYFWTTNSSGSTSENSALGLRYSDYNFHTPSTKNYAYAVRCVKE